MNQTFKRSVYLGLALAVALALPAGAEVVDAIAATVGTEVVLQSDLLAEIGPVLRDLRASASNEEEFAQLAQEQLRRALEQAIDNKILLRQALLTGLEVSDDVVEDRIRDIRKRYGSNEEFLRELEHAGETMSAFRDRMRDQMLAISMASRKRRELEEAVQISESEMAQHYQDNQGDFTHPERVRVRQIFLPAAKDDEAARAKAKARLGELKQELQAGADFSELAKAFSEGPEAEAGGLVGWVAKGDLVGPLEKAVFSLEPVNVSDVIETDYGCHLVKVEDKEASGTVSYDEARKDIEPLLRAQHGAERFDKWIKELRKRSRVRVYL